MSQLSPGVPAEPFESTPISAGFAGLSDDDAPGAVPGSAQPGTTVEAEVNHIVPGASKPAIYTVPPGQGESRREADYAAHKVRIRDARPMAAELSLDRQGLSLVRHETAVADFYDDEEVKAVYYPEIERLLKAATGAAKVVIFDHTTRVDGGSDKAARRPVRTVHNDYTLRSGPQRVRDLLEPDEAEAWLRGRFAVINVWRPIHGPVETAPIAVADARFMGPDDFVATDLVYPDRTGEIYDVAYNPAHRWYYMPRMERSEALLLKCYDSATDGRARFTAHTAFDDPTTPPDATPRESIEVRTLVFFPES